jgi:formylglycine-generating enzyme required for sulfatase activity
MMNKSCPVSFQILAAAIGSLLLLLSATACGIEVPGGGDDLRPPTPDQSKPTVTPVVIAPSLFDTPTSVAPPPTPPPPTVTPQPTTDTQAQPTAPETPSASTAPVGTVGELVQVPAGPFTMGSNDFDVDEKPAHPVDLPAYQIDKYPVVNALFDAFIKATGFQTDPEKRGESRSWRNYFTPDKANHPVVKVTWFDAKAFCEWAGKRLPTEAEWEKAARGTDGRNYPWGSDYDPSKFNGRASGIRGTTAVGSYPAGASPYGVLDMAGNVWEWTADWYLPYPGNTVSSPYFGEKFRVTRGGGWFDEKDQVRTSNRNSADPNAANDDLGFRCVK